jgi:hypothetical protein
MLKSSGVETVKLPAQSLDLNACAERGVLKGRGRTREEARPEKSEQSRYGCPQKIAERIVKPRQIRELHDCAIGRME